MDVRVIHKPQLALREIVESRFKRVNDARIKIGMGPGADDGDNGSGKIPSNKKICIMEAVSFIMGYEDINDHPACTSEVIRYFMIHCNDGIDSDRQRAKLKALIPDIVNTAPTKWKNEGEGKWRVVTDAADRDYKAAEKARTQIVRDMYDERYRAKRVAEFEYAPLLEVTSTEDLATAILRYERSPMPVIYEIVRKLVAVAKFEGEAREPTTEETD